MKKKITATINNAVYEIEADTRKSLLDYLREEANCQSVHKGCDEGECGACTVLFNGKPVCSCLVLMPQIDGAEIVTVEGLLRGEELHPLMQAFVENQAIQCGFCSPGMLISAYYFLNTRKDFSDEDIRSGLEGNLCRCTGYSHIIKAIRAAEVQRNSGNWW